MNHSLPDKQKIAIWGIIALFLCGIGGIPETAGYLYYICRVLCLGVLLIIVLLREGYSFQLALLTLICFPEITQGAGDVIIAGSIKSSSPWSSGLYVSPGVVLLMVFGIKIVAGLTTIQKALRFKEFVIFILYFSIVPVVTAVIYYDVGELYLSRVFSDFRYPLLLALGFVYSVMAISNGRLTLNDVYKILVIGAVARMIFDLAVFFFGEGTVISGVNRVSTDSTKGTVVLVLLAGIQCLSYRSLWKLVGMIAIVLSLVLITIYMTRLLWLMSLVAIFVYVFYSGKKGLFFTAPVAATVGLVIVLASFAHFSDDISRVLSGRLSSLTIYFDSSYGIDIRQAQVINVTKDSWEKKSFMWGSGYGSFFSDQYVAFGSVLTSAYSLEETMMRKFHRVHSIIFHLYFKYGLLGLAVVFYFWGRSWWRAGLSQKYYPVGSTRRNDISVLLGFAIVAFMHFNWTAKGLLLSGIIIGIIASYERLPAYRGRSVGPQELCNERGAPGPHHGWS